MKYTFIVSLLSGSGLAFWVLSLSLGFGLLVEGHFHSESSFRVRSCCWGFELMVGLWRNCLKDIFIVSLPSGSGLAVWVLNLLLGFGLPVGEHFHNESSFWVRSSCLSFELMVGLGSTY